MIPERSRRLISGIWEHSEAMGNQLKSGYLQWCFPTAAIPITSWSPPEDLQFY